MYEYARRPGKLKNFILIFLLMIVVSAASIFIYSMYTKINIEDYTKTPEAIATRLYSDEENVKEQEELFSKNQEFLLKSKKSFYGIDLLQMVCYTNQHRK